MISSGKAPLFLHKIENMVYNTPGQYENIQNDTEVKRSERTTESGADRKKVKRNGYVKWRGGAYSMLVSFTILIAANIKERKERAWTPVYLPYWYF